MKGKSSFNGTSDKGNTRKAVTVSGVRCTTNGPSLVIEVDGAVTRSAALQGHLVGEAAIRNTFFGSRGKTRFFQALLFFFLDG